MTGIQKRGRERVRAGTPALIIVRSPCTHNSRELREAHTLASLGYRPQILGVVSEQVRDRHAAIQGIPVTRLAPTSPLSWVRSGLRRSGRPAAAAAASGGPGGSGGIRVAIRVHRWMRTLDYYRRAIAVVRRLRPALIHCNDYNTMWVGVAARLMGGTAVVYDAHELWADRNLRPEPRWWLLACESLFVRCAPHDHRQPRLRRGDGPALQDRAPRVIRNLPASGPSPGAVSPRRSASPPRGSEGEDSLALYVGALTRGRGLEISIRALALVSGARLRLVGPAQPAYRAELAEVARREGVADRVEFANAVPPEKVVETIAEASVGLALIQPVCLSYRMSLPNKLFEYVAAGVPVLGSDLPAIGRLIREYEIGLVAQPDQVTDVAAKLSEMLRPDRNDQFRLAVQEAACQLRWDRESALLAETYVEAASTGRLPTP